MAFLGGGGRNRVVQAWEGGRISRGLCHILMPQPAGIALGCSDFCQLYRGYTVDPSCLIGLARASFGVREKNIPLHQEDLQTAPNKCLIQCRPHGLPEPVLVRIGLTCMKSHNLLP